MFTLYDGAGLERIGQKPGQFVGQSVFDVYTRVPGDRGRTRRALDGESVTYLFRTVGVALEVHLAPVRDALGEISGTIGVAIDVSDRMQAQEALGKSEERYRAIFETHRVVRLLVDPATGLIEEANRAACEFYGYTAEEMAGMPVSRSTRRVPSRSSRTCGARETRTSRTLKFKHRLKSGEIRDVDVHSGPVEVDGRTLLYSLVQDVTERRTAESLVAAQRQLLEMVAVGAPLSDVLERLTEVVEERRRRRDLLDPAAFAGRHAAAPRGGAQPA